MKFNIKWLKRHLNFSDENLLLNTLNSIGIEATLENNFFEISIPTNRNDLKSVRGLARELSLFIGGFIEENLKVFNNKPDFKIENKTDLKLAFLEIKNLEIKKEIEEIMKENSIPTNMIGLCHFIYLDEGIAMHLYDNKFNDLKLEYSVNEKFLDMITNNEPVMKFNEKILCISGVKGESLEKNSKNIIFEAGEIDKKYIKRNISMASKHFLNGGNFFSDAINGLLRLQTIINGDFSSLVIPNYTLDSSDFNFDNTYENKELKETNKSELEEKNILDNLLNFKKINSVNFNENNLNKFRKIQLPFSFIYSLTGLEVTANQIIEKLNAIGFKSSFERLDTNFFLDIEIPYYRLDIENNSDMCGEIIRLFPSFYEKIEKKTCIYKEYVEEFSNIKEVLLSNGFSEIITSSLLLEEKTDILLRDSNYFLRSSLSQSFNEWKKKQKLLHMKNYQFFEIGKIFNSESEKLVIGLFVKGEKEKNWNLSHMKLDVFYLKNIISTFPYKVNILKYDFDESFIEIEVLKTFNTHKNLNDYFDISFFVKENYNWAEISQKINCLYHIIDIYKDSRTIRIYEKKEKMEEYIKKLKTLNVEIR